jgi:ABC-type sugar transport system substrate-binding protein
MANSRIRRTAAALVLASSLGLLPAAEALPRARPRSQEPTVAQVQAGPSLVQTFWNLLTSFWAKAGAKIDGNG